MFSKCDHGCFPPSLLEVFIPSHDSLMVNLKESKEVLAAAPKNTNNNICLKMCLNILAVHINIISHFNPSVFNLCVTVKFTVPSPLSPPPRLPLVQLVKDLLTSLPAMFAQSRETHSALGPALQAAFKLMSPTGGRITVFQTQLPTLGAGALQSREDPNQRSSTKVSTRSLDLLDGASAYFYY